MLSTKSFVSAAALRAATVHVMTEDLGGLLNLIQRGGEGDGYRNMTGHAYLVNSKRDMGQAAAALFIYEVRSRYVVPIANTEKEFENLPEAEAYLYEYALKEEFIRPTIDDRIEKAVVDAENEFWTVISSCFPEASSGDLEPPVVHRFREACEEVVRRWIDANIQRCGQCGKLVDLQFGKVVGCKRCDRAFCSSGCYEAHGHSVNDERRFI